ncbi:hypothetical protein WA158_005065 [Blastocystis sp. Blastoise]
MSSKTFYYQFLFQFSRLCLICTFSCVLSSIISSSVYKDTEEVAEKQISFLYYILHEMYIKSSGYFTANNNDEQHIHNILRVKELSKKNIVEEYISKTKAINCLKVLRFLYYLMASPLSFIILYLLMFIWIYSASTIYSCFLILFMCIDVFMAKQIKGEGFMPLLIPNNTYRNIFFIISFLCYICYYLFSTEVIPIEKGTVLYYALTSGYTDMWLDIWWEFIVLLFFGLLNKCFNNPIISYDFSSYISPSASLPSYQPPSSPSFIDNNHNIHHSTIHHSSNNKNIHIHSSPTDGIPLKFNNNNISNSSLSSALNLNENYNQSDSESNQPTITDSKDILPSSILLNNTLNSTIILSSSSSSSSSILSDPLESLLDNQQLPSPSPSQLPPKTYSHSKLASFFETHASFLFPPSLSMSPITLPPYTMTTHPYLFSFLLYTLSIILSSVAICLLLSDCDLFLIIAVALGIFALLSGHLGIISFFITLMAIAKLIYGSTHLENIIYRNTLYGFIGCIMDKKDYVNLLHYPTIIPSILFTTIISIQLIKRYYDYTKEYKTNIYWYQFIQKYLIWPCYFVIFLLSIYGVPSVVNFCLLLINSISLFYHLFYQEESHSLWTILCYSYVIVFLLCYAVEFDPLFSLLTSVFPTNEYFNIQETGFYIYEDDRYKDVTSFSLLFYNLHIVLPCLFSFMRAFYIRQSLEQDVESPTGKFFHSRSPLHRGSDSSRCSITPLELMDSKGSLNSNNYDYLNNYLVSEGNMHISLLSDTQNPFDINEDIHGNIIKEQQPISSIPFPPPSNLPLLSQNNVIPTQSLPPKIYDNNRGNVKNSTDISKSDKPVNASSIPAKSSNEVNKSKQFYIKSPINRSKRAISLQKDLSDSSFQSVSVDDASTGDSPLSNRLWNYIYLNVLHFLYTFYGYIHVTKNVVTSPRWNNTYKVMILPFIIILLSKYIYLFSYWNGFKEVESPISIMMGLSVNNRIIEFTSTTPHFLSPKFKEFYSNTYRMLAPWGNLLLITAGQYLFNLIGTWAANKLSLLPSLISVFSIEEEDSHGNSSISSSVLSPLQVTTNMNKDIDQYLNDQEKKQYSTEEGSEEQGYLWNYFSILFLDCIEGIVTLYNFISRNSCRLIDTLTVTFIAFGCCTDTVDGLISFISLLFVVKVINIKSIPLHLYLYYVYLILVVIIYSLISFFQPYELTVSTPQVNHYIFLDRVGAYYILFPFLIFFILLLRKQMYLELYDIQITQAKLNYVDFINTYSLSIWNRIRKFVVLYISTICMVFLVLLCTQSINIFSTIYFAYTLYFLYQPDKLRIPHSVPFKILTYITYLNILIMLIYQIPYIPDINECTLYACSSLYYLFGLKKIILVPYNGAPTCSEDPLEEGVFTECPDAFSLDGLLSLILIVIVLYMQTVIQSLRCYEDAIRFFENERKQKGRNRNTILLEQRERFETNQKERVKNREDMVSNLTLILERINHIERLLWKHSDGSLEPTILSASAPQSVYIETLSCYSVRVYINIDKATREMIENKHKIHISSSIPNEIYIDRSLHQDIEKDIEKELEKERNNLHDPLFQSMFSFHDSINVLHNSSTENKKIFDDIESEDSEIEDSINNDKNNENNNNNDNNSDNNTENNTENNNDNNNNDNNNNENNKMTENSPNINIKNNKNRLSPSSSIPATTSIDNISTINTLTNINLTRNTLHKGSTSIHGNTCYLDGVQDDSALFTSHDQQNTIPSHGNTIPEQNILLYGGRQRSYSNNDANKEDIYKDQYSLPNLSTSPSRSTSISSTMNAPSSSIHATSNSLHKKNDNSSISIQSNLPSKVSSPTSPRNPDSSPPLPPPPSNGLLTSSMPFSENNTLRSSIFAGIELNEEHNSIYDGLYIVGYQQLPKTTILDHYKMERLYKLEVGGYFDIKSLLPDTLYTFQIQKVYPEGRSAPYIYPISIKTPSLKIIDFPWGSNSAVKNEDVIYIDVSCVYIGIKKLNKKTSKACLAIYLKKRLLYILYKKNKKRLILDLSRCVRCEYEKYINKQQDTLLITFQYTNNQYRYLLIKPSQSMYLDLFSYLSINLYFD